MYNTQHFHLKSLNAILQHPTPYCRYIKSINRIETEIHLQYIRVILDKIFAITLCSVFAMLYMNYNHILVAINSIL